MNLKALLIATLIIATIGMAKLQPVPAQAQTIATPTYDPFSEPPLPKNPTALENGRHLYWRHCMPCHGDVGQGLTEEFRVLWDDHQNCWEGGCHGGRRGDEGFPIPEVVPALANDLPSRFTPDTLFEYLQNTHPPQDPGLLSDAEYHALVAFLYHLNGTTVPAATPAWTASPPPSLTPTPQGIPLEQAGTPLGLWPVIGLAVIMTALVLLRQSSETG